MTAITPLPAAATVRLREEYETDRKELAECNRLDECGDWVDRAAALASYAEEVKDQALEAMAQRIRARAIRRAGELLNQIDRPEQGGRPKRGRDGATVSRRRAAQQAGMSKGQQVQAQRVANVPEAEFERQVESPTPPTVTELARQGKRARQGRPPASSAARPIIDLKGRGPEETNRAIPFAGAIGEALRSLEKLDLEAVPLLHTEERVRLLNLLGQLDVITNGILLKLSEGRSVPRCDP